MVLTLEPADEGGYLVTSPFDPELITEAESLEEAFEMARDAAAGLRKVRAKLFNLVERNPGQAHGCGESALADRK